MSMALRETTAAPTSVTTRGLLPGRPPQFEGGNIGSRYPEVLTFNQSMLDWWRKSRAALRDEIEDAAAATLRTAYSRTDARVQELTDALETLDSTLSARIALEEQIRLSADEALATSITTLDTRLTSAESGLTANASAIISLEARVTQTEEGFESLSSITSQLNSRLTNAEGDILSQATAVTELLTRVTEVEGEVDVMSSLITDLDARTTLAEGSIEAQATAISELSVRVTSNEDGILVLSQLVTDIDARMDIAEANLVAQGDAISTLDTRVLATEGELSVISTAVDDLSARLTTTEGDLISQASALSVLTARVTQTESTLEVVSSLVTTLDSRMAVAESGLTALGGAVSSLDTRVTATEDELNVVSTAITNLDARLTTSEGDLVSFASAVSVLTARVTQTEDSLESFSSLVTTLDSRLTIAEGDLVATGSAISALDTRVTANETGLAIVNSATTDLDARLTTAEGDLVAQSDAISTLSAGVLSLEGTVSSFSALVTELNSRVATAEGDIAAQAGAIDTLNTRVTVAEGLVDVLSTSVTALDARVVSAEGDIISQAGAISTLTSRVTQTENDISVVSSLVTDLGSRLVTAEGDLIGVAGAISSLNSRVTANEEGIDVVSSLVTALGAQLISVEGDVTANATALLDLTSRVTANEGAITSQSSLIVSLDARLIDAETGVAGLSTALSSLDSRVTVAEGNIVVNSTAITNLDSRLFDAEGSVAANATALSVLDTRVTSTEAGIVANATQITDLGARLGDAESDIFANSDALVALDTRVIENETQIVSMSSFLVSLDARLIDAESGTSGNAYAIFNLDTRVTDNEAGIASQATALTAISASLEAAVPPGLRWDASGNITFKPNYYPDAATFNAGEIYVSWSSGATGYIDHPTLGRITMSAIGLTTPFEGTHTPPREVFYVMFTATAISTRWPNNVTNGAIDGNLAIVAWTGTEWRAYSNDAASYYAFTPVESDVLLGIFGKKATSTEIDYGRPLFASTNGLNAFVVSESSARASADGYLEGKYTLNVGAGNVVTGMNITSSTGGGTNVSDVTFKAANFKVITDIAGVVVTPFEISAGTVKMNANVLIDGTVTAAKVAANSITAGKIVVNGSTSMITDSGVKDPVVWSAGTGQSLVTDADSEVKNSLRAVSAGKVLCPDFALGNHRYWRPTDNYLPNIIPGRKYRIRARLWASATANKAAWLQINYVKASDGTHASLSGTTTVQPGTANVTGGYITSGVFTAPADSVKWVPYFGIRYNDPNSDAGSGHWLFTDFEIRDLTDSTLIEDGAITADKIETNLSWSKNFIVGSSGNIRGGATNYSTGTGFWLGDDSGTYKFRIGDPAGFKLSWDGANLDLVAKTATLGSAALVASTESGGLYGNISTLKATGWDGGYMRVFGALSAGGSAGLAAGNNADTVARFQLFYSGQMEWGSGSATRDVQLSRTAADTLSLAAGDSLILANTNDVSLTSTNHALQIGTYAGANLSFDTNEIMARSNGVAADLYMQHEGGRLHINSGISPTTSSNGLVIGSDCNLFRIAANVLGTEDTFRALAYQDTNGAQVVGTRQSAIASISPDSPVYTNTGDYATDASTIQSAVSANAQKINAILSMLRTHGLIAT